MADRVLDGRYYIRRWDFVGVIGQITDRHRIDGYFDSCIGYDAGPIVENPAVTILPRYGFRRNKIMESVPDFLGRI